MIDVIGIGAEGAAGLKPTVIERIQAADFLAGGARHLAYFPEAKGGRFVVRDNLDELATILQRFAPSRRVVLASGDPLFYGIGRFLLERFPDARIEPALSSMQMAFARAGIPWQDAALASIHGRGLRATLLPLLGRPVIGLFTQDGRCPERVAAFFLRHGLADYRAIVAENLGALEERVLRVPNLGELADRSFAPLNYLILARNSADAEAARRRRLGPGISDHEFARPEGTAEVMTRQEVRSVILAKLLIPTEPGDSCWDIGAGLGTVAIEVALLRPDMEVLAVERDPVRARLLRAHHTLFETFNVRPIEGDAPETFNGEREAPRLVFIGGSGGRLADILDVVHERLMTNGRLVASFVTLEHLATMLEWLKSWRWPFEVTEVHVARSDALGGLTGLKPMRGVFIVSADKPGNTP